MKTQLHQFNDSNIERVLFHNKAPEVNIYPFRKSCVEKLRLMNFRIQLASRSFDETRTSLYSRLSKVIVSIKNTKLTEPELFQFLSTTSMPLVNLIFIEALHQFSSWKNFFYTKLADYTKQPISKFQWEVAQSIGINSVMTLPLSMEQQLWIAYASAFYRQDERKFVVDVVESIKPWLNQELYRFVEKVKANKKTNVEYEEHKKQMISGTFGLPESDKAIITKLEEVEYSKTHYNSDDDLDIIK